MSCTGDGTQDHGLRLVLEPTPGPVPEEGSGPVSGPGPADARTGGTVVLAKIRTGSKVTPAEHITAFLKARSRRFKARAELSAAKSTNKRGLASMVTSRAHKMYAGQPGSIASHRAHVKAAAWFPEELEGSWLKWVRFAWCAFGFTWCRFLKILGNTIGSAGDHARTAFVLLVIVIVLVIYFA